MRIENEAESEFVNVKEAQEVIPPAYVARRNRFLCSLSVYKFRARICRPLKETRNRFPAWRAGTTTLFFVPARQAA